MRKILSPNDSRFYTSKLFFKERWPFTRKLTLFLLCITVSFIVTFYASSKGIEQPALNALFILVLATSLWITEAIPPFSVSILIIGYSIYFLHHLSPVQISEDWQKYTGTWSSPIIWILLGGFILALGAQITGFDRKFSEFVILRFGSNPKNLLLGMMLTTAVLSMFMSNTATAAMMLAIATPMVLPYGKNEPFRKALILGIACAATLGGMGTVIGSPPNAIAVGVIQSVKKDFGFVEWMYAGLPLALVMVVAAWKLLTLKYKTQIKEINIFTSPDDEDEEQGQEKRNTVRNRTIVVITFILTVGLWMTSAIHGIPVAVVSFIPIVIFAVSGLVRADDIKMLPWDTLLLVAGGLTLGIVITETGLAEALLDKIPSDSHNLIILLVLAYLSTLLSNVMSNTAAASILIPVGTTFLPGAGIVVPIVIGLCASTALLLPISTPPNALAYSTGLLNQSDFRYIGAIAGLFAPPIIIAVVMLIY